MGDLKLSGNKQCTLTGNILGGTVSITDSPVTSSYNIYQDVNSENEFIASTDLVRSETDMMPSDGKIVLANHGGFTPTIALESDKLSDGTSIRFPLSKTTVITDQRGVARLENTCMGAYEIECSNDTTLVRDTIYVGEKFMDVTYSQVGVHDSIFENLKAKNGCDSVVMHTLLVKPDPTVKEYYVKTKREGKGDGSSWENAMDGEDFAAVLPLAPDGVTFYVAEGTYKPIYGQEFSRPNFTSSLIYEINGDVTIRGGYPATAKTGSVSDPKKYETIFNGDILNDDIAMENYGEDGFIVFSFSSELFSNNSKNIFSINSDNSNVTFDGVSFYNANSLSSNSSNINVSVNNCRYFHIYGPMMNLSSEDGRLSFRDVIFEKNIYCSGVVNDMSSVSYENVSFEDNIAPNGLINFTHVKNLSMSKVVAHGNYTSFLNNGGHWDIKDCDFYDNKCAASYFFNNVGTSSVRQSTHIQSSRISNMHGDLFNMWDGPFIIDSCEFSNNNFQSNSVHVDSFIINSSSFIGNKFNHFWYPIGSGLSKMSHCYIYNNESKYSFWESYNSYVFEIDSCRFINNKCGFVDCSATVRDSIRMLNSVVESNSFDGDLIYLSCYGYKFIENSTISKNTCNSALYFNGIANSLVNSCVIDSNLVSSSLLIGSCPLDLNNSSIINNETKDSVLIDIKAKTNFCNNTIALNKSGNVIFRYNERTIVFGNNTIFSNRPSKSLFMYAPGTNGVSVDSKIIGNIIISKSSIGDISVPKSYNNLFSSNCTIDNQNYINEDELNLLFDGKYNENNDIYEPFVSYNGGFTPTIALKTDHLPDGTSIRFPLTETTVTEDQRGVARLESTCMGAYEIACVGEVQEATDTIGFSLY